MENKETVINKTNKIIETLTKELESLSPEGLHEFFKFFYYMNHAYGNMITQENFEEFLEAFDSNPFKVNDDKKFRKQLTEKGRLYYNLCLLPRQHPTPEDCPTDYQHYSYLPDSHYR